MRRPAPATAAAAWLLLDMTLVTGVTVLVKLEGQSRPVAQMVFLRAAIGLVLIAPLVWRHRRDFARMRAPWRNAGRVACNAVALGMNFTALTLLPLAVVTGISFTRPLVAMGLAALLLGETVRRLHWAGAAVALAGVLLMIAPDGSGGALPAAGLAAAALSVLFGAMAAIQTRALRGESLVVMMLFYTLGLAVLSAPLAALDWAPVGRADLWPLIGIGVLAQAGQYCFLRAYALGEASRLAPLGYLSILLATAAGWIVFGDRPGPSLALGGAVVVLGMLLVRRADRPAAAAQAR
ncbi:DMT family transporter [Limimaricola pyoseonensis]|uniref:S-adenosylmethionine uptake transporter n=1 Tax=Limimaricola pyoseonensis TaxID=521013 RepID=A0A1G7HL57_9RHOB|nr:DMT family transporter [Limimaricola pyoseonensis]SDF01128.1 S-adenosylmethionine uptake transporter [Limimaricola pyoseonensis]